MPMITLPLAKFDERCGGSVNPTLPVRTPVFRAVARGVRRFPRISLSIGIVAVVLATLLGGFIVHGFHQASAKTLSAGTLILSPTSGVPGTHLFMNASGFAPGENVEAIWNYTGPGTGVVQKSFYEYNPTVKADANGNASTSLWVSATQGGTYTVAAQGLSSGTVATANFTVLASLEPGVYIAPAGTTLRLRGWGFAAREAINVYWNWGQPGQTLIAKASTDSKGDWSGKTYQVPTGTANGTYPLAAVGVTSGFTATAQYTVGLAPTGAGPQPGDWANFGYDLQDTRVNPVETTISLANVSTLRQKWAASTLVTPYKILGSPVVANGVVYVGTIQGYVLAYNITNGALLWQFSASAPIYGSPTVANGLLYFGTVKNPSQDTTGNYLYCLNATTGALVWANYLTLGSVWVPPTVYNGVVYVNAALKEATSGGFYAFDALTGATVWSVATPSGNWSVPVFDPSGANVYFATGNPCLSNPPLPQNTPQTDGCSGSIFDLNPATGATIWSYHFPDYTGDDDAPATPAYAVLNGTPYLFEGVKNGLFYCLNATTGAVVWQYDTGNRGDSGIYSSAAYANGVVYFGGYKTLFALNASTGALVWTVQPVGTVVSSPAYANGVLYTTTESGYIVALNPADGSRVWYTRFLNTPIYSSPVISNGVLYASVSDGYLYAFSPNGQ